MDRGQVTGTVRSAKHGDRCPCSECKVHDAFCPCMSCKSKVHQTEGICNCSGCCEKRQEAMRNRRPTQAPESGLTSGAADPNNPRTVAQAYQDLVATGGKKLKRLKGKAKHSPNKLTGMERAILIYARGQEFLRQQQEQKVKKELEEMSHEVTLH